mmetsp:Transcript_111832/g.228965  ORF Transcript_111832/g.228965 Transcript_111832/m.228965 type:complete len:340 (+) Transcript_111832:1047-2066(+)
MMLSLLSFGFVASRSVAFSPPPAVKNESLSQSLSRSQASSLPPPTPPTPTPPPPTSPLMSFSFLRVLASRVSESREESTSFSVDSTGMLPALAEHGDDSRVPPPLLLSSAPRLSPAATPSEGGVRAFSCKLWSFSSSSFCSDGPVVVLAVSWAMASGSNDGGGFSGGVLSLVLPPLSLAVVAAIVVAVLVVASAVVASTGAASDSVAAEGSAPPCFFSPSLLATALPATGVGAPSGISATTSPVPVVPRACSVPLSGEGTVVVSASASCFCCGESFRCFCKSVRWLCCRSFSFRACILSLHFFPLSVAGMVAALPVFAAFVPSRLAGVWMLLLKLPKTS